MFQNSNRSNFIGSLFKQKRLKLSRFYFCAVVLSSSHFTVLYDYTQSKDSDVSDFTDNRNLRKRWYFLICFCASFLARNLWTNRQIHASILCLLFLINVYRLKSMTTDNK